MSALRYIFNAFSPIIIPIQYVIRIEQGLSSQLIKFDADDVRWCAMCGVMHTLHVHVGYMHNKHNLKYTYMSQMVGGI